MAKEKLKKEINAYKYNKQLENTPEVQRAKLQKEVALQRERIAQVREQKQFEKDKAELKSLQRSNSKFGNVLTQVREHLDNVKKRQGKTGSKGGMSLGTGRNIIYDKSPTNSYTKNSFMSSQPTSLIRQDVRPKGSVFGHSGGVFGAKEPTLKPKKSKKSKTIVINVR